MDTNEIGKHTGVVDHGGVDDYWDGYLSAVAQHHGINRGWPDAATTIYSSGGSGDKREALGMHFAQSLGGTMLVGGEIVADF